MAFTNQVGHVSRQHFPQIQVNLGYSGYDRLLGVVEQIPYSMVDHFEHQLHVHPRLMRSVETVSSMMGAWEDFRPYPAAHLNWSILHQLSSVCFVLVIECWKREFDSCSNLESLACMDFGGCMRMDQLQRFEGV